MAESKWDFKVVPVPDSRGVVFSTYPEGKPTYEDAEKPFDAVFYTYEGALAIAASLQEAVSAGRAEGDVTIDEVIEKQKKRAARLRLERAQAADA